MSPIAGSVRRSRSARSAGVVESQTIPAIHAAVTTAAPSIRTDA